MSNFLKNHPKINGLSKNKIIGALGIFFSLIFTGMIWGVFNGNNDDTPKSDIVENKFNLKDNDVAINQIITTANIDKAKLAAADDASNSKKVESIPSLTLNIPPIAKNIVPLKTDNSSGNAIKDKYNQKLQDNKYGSYAAKSLMYDKPLLSNQDNLNKNNASANIIPSKSSYPTNSIDVGGTSSGISPVNGNSEDQNMQNEKHNFIKNGDTSDKDYLSSKLMVAKSPYEVKAGSVIPATMISGLNSDLPGQIVAQVRQNVYDSSTRQYLLIPQGSKLIGLYDSNIAYGQERVLVIWNRLIYPNGDSINLKGMPGTDLQGYAGFHDIVDNKYWKIFGTSFVMGVITGAMQYSQNNTNPNVQVGGLGLSSNPSVSQTMAGSLGQQLGQTGLSIAQKNLNVQPTLIIRPNYPFTLMITSDIILKPYFMIQ